MLSSVSVCHCLKKKCQFTPEQIPLNAPLHVDIYLHLKKKQQLMCTQVAETKFDFTAPI